MHIKKAEIGTEQAKIAANLYLNSSEIYKNQS